MATKQTKQTVAQPSNAVQAYDWSQEQTTGFEATRPEDLGIPFLSLLQKGSPEVDEEHPDYGTKGIEGAKAGMVLNTLKRRLVYLKDEQQPLEFVPVFYEKLYQEWKPRDNGGGFVQSHRSPVILTQTKRNEKNEDVLPNGNIIITTSYFYGFYNDAEDGWTRVILPMTSTQLKKARSWLNMMQSIKIGGKVPPMFSHVYHLTTLGESNEKGNWAGWKIVIGRTLDSNDSELIQSCREVATSCVSTKQLTTGEGDGAGERPF